MQQGPNVLAHADADHWRRNYTDQVKTMESEERKFRALENLLRRVISRLFLATKGLSPQLDHETSRWAGALHNKTLAFELEPLFLPLSDAIAALANTQSGAAVAAKTESVAVAAVTAVVPVPASVSAVIDGDAEIRRNLLALLGAVRRDTNLAPLVAEIEVQAIGLGFARLCRGKGFLGFVEFVFTVGGNPLLVVFHFRRAECGGDGAQ